MIISDYDMFMRVFLALFFTGIAGFYTIRIVTLKPKIRRLYLGRIGSSHWLGHVTFRFFRLVIWWTCVARVFYPSIDKFLLTCSYLINPFINIAGALLMILGFVLALRGHFELGQHWRSGIDEDQPMPLVTTKLYSKSRNPMYIGVLMGQFGFFLALPSVFTFICLIVGITAILNQVRLEEQHFRKNFPEAYAEYQRRVPRWFFKLNRA